MSHRHERYRRHLDIIDADVAPVVDAYREHIQCRAGCSRCCHQTFRISDIEGEYLRVGLRAADPDVRADILARAKTYQEDSKEPCPVLSDDGRCRLYDHRPRICRKYGIPLWHPDRPHEVSTCELNFQGVPDIDPALILDPQAKWAQDWIELRRDLALPRVRGTSIAGMLVRED